MLEKISKLFSKREHLEQEDLTLKKDAVAELLRTSPEALAAFEAAYAKDAIDFDDGSVIGNRNAVNGMVVPEECAVPEGLDVLIDRIVNELLAQTNVYTFNGDLTQPDGITFSLKCPPAGTQIVAQSEIKSVPEPFRPQLTGELMSVDVPEKTYPTLLFFYTKFLEERDLKKKQTWYHQFRQGLDILDLDSITYEILGMNQNSMSNWLPQLVAACRGQNFFRIPATTIARVPITLLQLSRKEYGSLTPTTMAIVDQWAYKAFKLDTKKEYFVKTGTYSSKFDFRNAHVYGEKEVRELGEYLLFIQNQAVIMAGPLCTPSVYGVSTTNEWVVREFIQDEENNPTIYKGLPLHTEYRVFVDCDTDMVLGITPYWDPETMKKRFGQGEDAGSPHQIHDYVIYKAHEDILMGRYKRHKDKVAAHVAEILPALNLHGQWSIDIMQNGEDFWIIDMAVAECSAFYEQCVPKVLRRPTEEDWLPKLPEAKN